MINKFWRVSPVSDNNRQLFGKQTICRSVDFINKLTIGDGLVMADWNESSHLAYCSTFGIVLSVDGPLGEVEAEWRPSDAIFRPNPQGLQYWRKQKGWFGFAPRVVEHYMLPMLFSEKFPDMDGLSFGTAVRANQSEVSASVLPVQGFVYLIRSPYGYKIGKSVNVKQRAQLFSVKLPFPIDVVHYARFDDYASAERSLHLKFQDKRLEGEWFDLNESEIAYIRTQGEVVDTGAL